MGYVLYFAYGSNMNWDQIRSRCPSAFYLARAVLRDHELCFPRLGKSWLGGVASVRRKPGEKVWGVLYELAEKELGSLDDYEGYDPRRRPDDNLYTRVKKTVYVNDDDSQPRDAWIYLANTDAGDQPAESQVESDECPPSHGYLETIIEGATHWGLPAPYIAKLRRFGQTTGDSA